jgi:hypothetical protein
MDIDTSTDKQYCWVKWTNTNTSVGSTHFLILRWDSATADYLAAGPHSSGNWKWEWYDNNTFDSGSTGGGTHNIVDGDWVGVAIEGTDPNVTIKMCEIATAPSTGDGPDDWGCTFDEWTSVDVPAVITEGLKTGLRVFQGTTDDAQADDYECGTW